jgi:heat shock protein HslJ
MWHYFLRQWYMKPLIIIATCIGLACQSSSSDNLPANDSTQTVKDTPAPPQKAIKDTTKLGGLWFLQPVLASDTATGKIPRIIFDLSSRGFSGNTGCNEMKGTFEYTDSTLTFNQHITTTKMNCVGYNEKAFLENLLRTNRYRLENGMLILMFDGTELSRWTRKVMPKPVSNKT